MLKIRETFPMVTPYLPPLDRLEQVGYGLGAVEVFAFTTHRSVFDPNWALNPEAFVLAPGVPPDFFAVGARFTNYEYLVVLWARGGRRFYFEGLFSTNGLLEAGGRDLLRETREDLSRTLAAWDRGSDAVVSNRCVVPEDLAWLPPTSRYNSECSPDAAGMRA